MLQHNQSGQQRNSVHRWCPDLGLAIDYLTNEVIRQRWSAHPTAAQSHGQP